MSAPEAPKHAAAKPAAKKGAGEPTEALAPLAKAIIDAAKADTGDPDVSRAFALGWHLAELKTPGKQAEDSRAGRLKRMNALDAGDRRNILLAQINADIVRLTGVISKAGLEPPKVEPDTSAETLNFELLKTLTAADFRLGKAYSLARSLADTCRNAHDKASLAELFRAERIATLLGWLDELSTALPPHAAGSVSLSLARWREAAAGTVELAMLRRQGELWRALLSGEKRGIEMLHEDDYLDAARALASKTGRLARSAVLRFPGLTALVVVLIAIGAYLLTKHSTQSTLAGAGSLLAAVGLTWKGFGGAVGKLVAAVEVPLWGAQLDIVIAKAITMVPFDPPKKVDPWKRKAVAKAIPRPDLQTPRQTKDPPSR